MFIVFIPILMVGLLIWAAVNSLSVNGSCIESVQATIVEHRYDSGCDEPSHYLACYEYTYNGQTYTGKRWKSPTGYYMKKKEDIEGLYPIGSQVSIYINPNEPYQHCWEPGGAASDNVSLVIVILVGLVFIGFFLWAMVMPALR